MDTVAKCIARIRRIAKIANDIEVSLDQLHGIDREFGMKLNEKTLARIGDVNVGERVLERFLDSLDMDTLRRIEALMYSGRDDQSAPALKRELKLPHETKEDVVRTIIEKQMNLDVYLDRGLDRARRDGIDLDSF